MLRHSRCTCTAMLKTRGVGHSGGGLLAHPRQWGDAPSGRSPLPGSVRPPRATRGGRADVLARLIVPHLLACDARAVARPHALEVGPHDLFRREATLARAIAARLVTTVAARPPAPRRARLCARLCARLLARLERAQHALHARVLAHVVDGRPSQPQLHARVRCEHDAHRGRGGVEAYDSQVGHDDIVGHLERRDRGHVAHVIQVVEVAAEQRRVRLRVPRGHGRRALVEVLLLGDADLGVSAHALPAVGAAERPVAPARQLWVALAGLGAQTRRPHVTQRALERVQARGHVRRHPAA
eukprot:scaffold85010_cov36-Phaeocystis_antarctica.AAC.2